MLEFKTIEILKPNKEIIEIIKNYNFIYHLTNFLDINILYSIIELISIIYMSKEYYCLLRIILISY